MKTTSVYLQKLISSTVLIERILHPLHNSKHFLLFESSSNDLHTNRQARHLIGVIVFVCSLCNAIERLEVESGRECVFSRVDVCYWDDSC